MRTRTGQSEESDELIKVVPFCWSRVRLIFRPASRTLLQKQHQPSTVGGQRHHNTHPLISGSIALFHRQSSSSNLSLPTLRADGRSFFCCVCVCVSWSAYYPWTSFAAGREVADDGKRIVIFLPRLQFLRRRFVSLDGCQFCLCKV